jgi:hypothetical protein
MGNLLWVGVYPYQPGYPTKTIVVAQRAIEGRVTLRGWDCASGNRLRFWYREGSPFLHLPVTAAALRRTGSLTATWTSPWRKKAMTGLYLMFWHEGLWKLTVYHRRHKLGSAIVQALPLTSWPARLPRSGAAVPFDLVAVATSWKRAERQPGRRLAQR